MSSNSRGGGRGGGGRNRQPRSKSELDVQTAEHSESSQKDMNSFGPPTTDQHRPRRVAPRSAEELRRIMDIVDSRLSVIIDSLEGNEDEASLKRNVVTSVKHLKQISELLSSDKK